MVVAYGNTILESLCDETVMKVDFAEQNIACFPVNFEKFLFKNTFFTEAHPGDCFRTVNYFRKNVSL